MANGSVSVVIADDHGLFREGLRQLVDAEPDLRVVGVSATGDETLQLVRQLAPDVLLLDLAMPKRSGLDVLRELSASESPTRVIVVTAAISDTQMVEALQLGARGVLLKDVVSDLLFKCIRIVVQGQFWVGREAVATLVEGMRQARTRLNATAADQFALTPRQMEILRAVLTSQTNREIANGLGISEDTVKQHLTAIFDKCGVSNRVELALFAVHHKLVQP